MNSLEAMIAIIMVLVIVSIVVQVNITSSDILSKPEWVEKIRVEKKSGILRGEIVLGKGRSTVHNISSSSYLRWYFA